MTPIEDRGLVHLDFHETFPHVFWTSAWQPGSDTKDEHRYKLLSVRHLKAAKVRFVLLEELRDGSKRIIQEFEGPLEIFDADEMTRNLRQWFGVEFDQVDMTEVRTFQSFEERSKEIGWDVS